MKLWFNGNLLPEKLANGFARCLRVISGLESSGLISQVVVLFHIIQGVQIQIPNPNEPQIHSDMWLEKILFSKTHLSCFFCADGGFFF